MVVFHPPTSSIGGSVGSHTVARTPSSDPLFFLSTSQFQKGGKGRELSNKKRMWKEINIKKEMCKLGGRIRLKIKYNTQH